MEEKCLKTPVYTFETIFKDSAEVPVDIDFNLPDYCPEVSRILKCRAVARISSKSAEGRSITVDGSVTVTVIYSDESNTLNSYEYQYPFSKNFESAEDVSGAVINARAKCEYINCRAVTERKIDIHGAVGVYVTAQNRKMREIICDVDDENIEVLRSSAPATMPVSQAEKYILLEEEIDIGNSQPDIRCLIRYDAAVSISERKLLAGKAMIKGETVVNLLYCTEQGEAQPLDSKIPFSQLIELEGAGEDCECETEAYIAYLEVKPKFNSFGESRSFSLDGKICLKAEAYCDNDVEVITDAYSRKYDSQILSEDICFNKMVSNIKDEFNCKERIELSDGSLSRIEDLWCEVKSENAVFEGDCLVASGTVSANIIAVDESGTPAYYEKPIEYTYRYKLPVNGDNLRADVSVVVLSSSYNIAGDHSVEIKPQMAVDAKIYECKTVSLVNDIKTDENKPINRAGRGAMTVYFAESGEKIWDIARKYFADISEVKRLNNIENDTLANDTMILLPVN